MDVRWWRKGGSDSEQLPSLTGTADRASVLPRSLFFRFCLVFLFLSSLTQAVIESLIFAGDSQQRNQLSPIFQTFQPAHFFTYIEGSISDPTLELCLGVRRNEFMCADIIPGRPMPNELYSQFNSALSGLNDGLIRQCGITNSSSQPDGSANLNTTASANVNATPELQCLALLLNPASYFDQSSREDKTLICAFLWLAYATAIAGFYQSLHHHIAIFAMRVLTTAWCAYSLYETRLQRSVTFPPDFSHSFGPTYENRTMYEIAQLIFDVLCLLTSMYLMWRAFKKHNNITFIYSNASMVVMRLSKIFAIFQAGLSISELVSLATVGLWTSDRIFVFEAIRDNSKAIYILIFFGTAAFLIPWVVSGYYAVRRERQLFAAIFLILGFFLIAVWSIVFAIPLYTGTLLISPFLASVTIVSYIVMISNTLLGVGFRLSFGKGLGNALQTEALAYSISPAVVFLPTNPEILLSLIAVVIWLLRGTQSFIHNKLRPSSPPPFEKVHHQSVHYNRWRLFEQPFWRTPSRDHGSVSSHSSITPTSETLIVNVSQSEATSRPRTHYTSISLTVPSLHSTFFPSSAMTSGLSSESSSSSMISSGTSPGQLAYLRPLERTWGGQDQIIRSPITPQSFQSVPERESTIRTSVSAHTLQIKIPNSILRSVPYNDDGSPLPAPMPLYVDVRRNTDAGIGNKPFNSPLSPRVSSLANLGLSKPASPMPSVNINANKSM